MKIDELIKDAGSIAISGHIRPDGDCAGSVLALYLYIKKNYPDIEAQVYLEKPTEKLAFLAGYDEIDSVYKNEKSYDLMICLDAASFDRIGKASKYFESAKKTINIDHHISNTKFAGINIVEADSSSACEVLYNLLDLEKIDRDIAISLYTGILYDTGVFKYSSTSYKTMEAVAQLMKYDIPTAFIIDESFYSKTYDENRIYGYSILYSTLCYEGRVIYSYITREKMNEFKVSSRELEGIVSQLKLTRGVECAVFVYELGNGECKVSLRSSEYMDCNAVASAFGGGGHVRAAGCNIKGTVSECITKLLDEIGKYI